LGQQFIGQMGSNETGTTSNQNVAEHGKMLRNSKVKKARISGERTGS
jgi:hypothetical protein